MVSATLLDHRHRPRLHAKCSEPYTVHPGFTGDKFHTLVLPTFRFVVLGSDRRKSGRSALKPSACAAERFEERGVAVRTTQTCPCDP